jgi:hypothetical protein
MSIELAATTMPAICASLGAAACAKHTDVAKANKPVARASETFFMIYFLQKLLNKEKTTLRFFFH